MSISMGEMLARLPKNQTILSAAVKTADHIDSGARIVCSISGGSDSDIVMDLLELIGYAKGQVRYVWFDTGLEYEATKRHLEFLEQKYEVEIERHKAKKPIPISVKEYGVPFLSKIDSMYIDRLQKHCFGWELGSIEELIRKYPRCKSSIKWWCSSQDRFTAARSVGLKEFISSHEPPKISDKCCQYAKKNVAYEVEKGADLSIIGVRRAEGGVRAVAYKSCYTPTGTHIAQFRPIFYFTDQDKREYEEFRGVIHSDCYTVYGMKRTGCVGCPFNSNFERDLEAMKQYEPKLYQAANAIFGESYEYTRKYREFKASYKREKRRGGQIDLFDRWDEM